MATFINRRVLHIQMPLFIISTPIGNLQDITLRALETLKAVDLILAEDTRRTLKLLSHYSIRKKLISYGSHNEKMMTSKVIEMLKNSASIALVTDSGTPGIADPGFLLVREAIKVKIPIIPVPGPSAALAALVCSGLPCDRFQFIGFLPKKEGALRALLSSVQMTTVAYESPHRIQKTLAIMAEVIPQHRICIARELTKKFEECIRGSVEEVYEKMKNNLIKGELTLVIAKV